MDTGGTAASSARPLMPGRTFESLPTEIILAILTSVGDLTTLCELLHSSPVALRAFNAHDPAGIVEAVLTSGYTSQEVIFIFRFCVQARSRRLPSWDHEEFAANILVKPFLAAYRYHETAPRASLYAPEVLPRDVSLVIIHSLLRTARAITCLALDCLEVALERFESTNINVRDGALGSTRSPPTWSEEQRCLRAFWRLHAGCEADNSVLSRLMPSGCSVNEWWDMYGCIMHRINTTKESRKAPCYNFTYPAFYSASVIWPGEDEATGPNPEHPEMFSAIEYVAERFGEDAADDLACNSIDITALLREKTYKDAQSNISRARKWPLPMPSTNHKQRDHEEALLARPSVFAATVSAIQAHGIDSLIRIVGFGKFTPYGVAFWSHERMLARGIPAVPQEALSTTHSQQQFDRAWLDLLPPENTRGAQMQQRLQNCPPQSQKQLFLSLFFVVLCVVWSCVQ